MPSRSLQAQKTTTPPLSVHPPPISCIFTVLCHNYSSAVWVPGWEVLAHSPALHTDSVKITLLLTPSSPHCTSPEPEGSEQHRTLKTCVNHGLMPMAQCFSPLLASSLTSLGFRIFWSPLCCDSPRVVFPLSQHTKHCTFLFEASVLLSPVQMLSAL